MRRLYLTSPLFTVSKRWLPSAMDGRPPAPTGSTLSERYGELGTGVMTSVFGRHSEAGASAAYPIPGKASVDATHATIRRSTVFDDWHHVAAPPVGWAMSKLGCNTRKMSEDATESEEALQLQIIKGLNVFQIDGSASTTFQNVSKTLSEALRAFELPREGIVFVYRAGVLRETYEQSEETELDMPNTKMIRNRNEPLFKRFQSATMPVGSFKGGFKLTEMDDVQLSKLDLRRITPLSAAAITPKWLEASLTNLTYHVKLETIDVFLVEGIQTLYEDRDPMDAEEDMLELITFLEGLTKAGVVQYYGFVSPNFAPPLPRKYPPLPKGAMTLEQFRKPYNPIVLNLEEIHDLAKKVAGENHHFRFISYPFNLTQSQALGCKLPYSPRHSLVTLCQKLGITTLGANPIEAPCLCNMPQRYHKFPNPGKIAELRNTFHVVTEKGIMKEQELRPYVERVRQDQAPEWHNLFIISLYVINQRQFNNYFQFEDWCKGYALPKFRRNLMKLRDGAPQDVKDWSTQYETLVRDVIRIRKRMFEYKHWKKAEEIYSAIDALCPKMEQATILTQKAMNFAVEGSDVCLSGFHHTRYFHEATELNPGRAGGLGLTNEDLAILCQADEVSYCNFNPPSPFLLELPHSAGNVSGIPPPSIEHSVRIDPENPQYPDDPDLVRLDSSSS